MASSLFRATVIVGALLSIEAGLSASTILDGARAASSSLGEVRVIPLKEPHVLGEAVAPEGWRNHRASGTAAAHQPC